MSEDQAPYERPMFPLGTVLFPSAFLPLHVFEPRYQALTADVLATDEREFGVVLIERGHEVGGGDVRSSRGTIARVVEGREAPDGRWALAAVGLRRIEVVDWLDDDPYPRAMVRDVVDDTTQPVDADTLEALTARVRRLLAQLRELGEPTADATFELAEDAALATFQLGALSPIGAFDRQKLLQTDAVADRCMLIDEALADVELVVAARLGEAGGDD